MATGYVAPLGKFIAFTNGGLPLAGGRVYTYATGTSVPTPTWANARLDVPNSNPVILDSAGRASIFIADSATMVYTFVVKDANDVLVYSEDGISIPVTPASIVIGDSGGVPVGTILPYGGPSAPTGTGDGGAGATVFNYLMCDGALYSRELYSRLFAVIGTRYGDTDPLSFAVPNLRERMLLGVALTGVAATLGASGGAFDHRHMGGTHIHGIAPHRHGMAHTHQVPYSGWGAPDVVAAAPAHIGKLLVAPPTGNVTIAKADIPSGLSSESETLDFSGVTDPGAGGVGSEANPPYLTVNFIIKT